MSFRTLYIVYKNKLINMDLSYQKYFDEFRKEFKAHYGKTSVEAQLLPFHFMKYDEWVEKKIEDRDKKINEILYGKK